MRSDIERVEDVQKAIRDIEEFTAGGEQTFYSDKMIQSAVIYQIQIIGEAVYKLSEEFKKKYMEIPWARIERTRHILVHDYFDVNLNIVWTIIQKDLPELKTSIAKIIQ
jgi:uncharacterized protein with HEPN domain